ncbi:MAG: hypothetical protein QOF20_1745, partial [Acidimicrobiaceae bacterium]|nr:hypothetical protein [Acidimicrobiaceae bacterium]
MRGTPTSWAAYLTMTVNPVTVKVMEYTLDELVGAVAARLEAAGLQHQSNGQVSALPDRRTLRYYTTIGLMDRPDTVRDRQAIYGDRHVSQAVAVKQLQASGLALAAIQHRLAGLPLAQVEAIAEGREGDGTSAETRRRFWAEAPSSALHLAERQPLPPPAMAAAGWPAAAAGADDPSVAPARGSSSLFSSTAHPAIINAAGPPASVTD